MRTTYSIIGALVIIFSLTALAVEFPAPKEESKTVTVRENGKAFLEIKILAPATIEATGTITTTVEPGKKRTMRIKDGSVEIKPEK